MGPTVEGGSQQGIGVLGVLSCLDSGSWWPGKEHCPYITGAGTFWTSLAPDWVMSQKSHCAPVMIRSQSLGCLFPQP